MNSIPKNNVISATKIKRDLTGETFGEWTVIRFSEIKDSRSQWECRCSCGVVQILSSKILVGGFKKSCGCKRGAMISAGKSTHGLSKSPEYRVWCMIKTRCYNKNRRDYRWYGADGIRVCERWMSGNGTLGGFECFMADMGPRPTPKHTIERKDSKKDYGPENCEWLLAVLQPQNTRQVVKIIYKGESLCTSEVARRIGMKRATLAQRIRDGWDHERAISEPVFEFCRHGKIEFNSETHSVSEWAKKIGVTYQYLWKMLNGGMPPSEVLAYVKQRRSESVQVQA